VLVLSGPNLQLLGTREPAIYGTTTLADIEKQVRDLASTRGAAITFLQSNHEGALLDAIGAAPGSFDGILINAGAFTHTSLALFDALKAVALPAIEVHLSNPESREAFRHESKIAGACAAKVAGFGAASYTLALTGLLDLLDKRSQSH
jgi:3-dehydroquinate dehydratase-2